MEYTISKISTETRANNTFSEFNYATSSRSVLASDSESKVPFVTDFLIYHRPTKPPNIFHVNGKFNGPKYYTNVLESRPRVPINKGTL